MPQISVHGPRGALGTTNIVQTEYHPVFDASSSAYHWNWEHARGITPLQNKYLRVYRNLLSLLAMGPGGRPHFIPEERYKIVENGVLPID